MAIREFAKKTRGKSYKRKGIFLAVLLFVSFAPLAHASSRKEALEKKIASIKQREKELNSLVEKIVSDYRRGKLDKAQAAAQVKPYLSESIALARKTVKIVIDNLDILYGDLVAQDANYKSLSKEEVGARVKATYRALSRPGMEEEALQNILDNANFP